MPERTFMAPYPKIQSIFKRDETGRFTGEYSTPELEFLAGLGWLWTEKVDGTNIRLGWDSGLNPETAIAYIAGRTDKAQIPPKLLTVLHTLLVARTNAIREVFGGSRWVTFYGEGYGAGIQKGGGNYQAEPRFVLFDIEVCADDGMVWWLKRDAVETAAEMIGFDVVPVVGRFPLAEACKRTADPHGVMSMWSGVTTPEGLVGRPLVDLRDRAGNLIITKVKHRDWRNL